MRRTLIPLFVVYWQPPNRYPISWPSALILVQIKQTHWTIYKITLIMTIIAIMQITDDIHNNINNDNKSNNKIIAHYILDDVSF